MRDEAGSYVTVPMRPVVYNNFKTIVQTDDHVMILVEWMHWARMVRMNGEHLPDDMRSMGGDHIDVSVQQAVLTGAQIPTLLYEYRGLAPGRYSSVGPGAGACFMLPTADGYIGLNALTRPQWRMLCEFLGRKDIAENERYRSVSWVNPDERIEELREAFQAALADRTADELFHEAEKWRVPFGLVPDMASLFALPPHRHRGFFVPLEHPVAGTTEVPGIPFRATGTAPTAGAVARRPMPTRNYPAGKARPISTGSTATSATSRSTSPIRAVSRS